MDKDELTRRYSAYVQVYINPDAIDDELVQRICASAQHPHAVDAFVSMATAPRGAKEMGTMVQEICSRGIPVCMLHGALPADAVNTLPRCACADGPQEH